MPIKRLIKGAAKLAADTAKATAKIAGSTAKTAAKKGIGKVDSAIKSGLSKANPLDKPINQNDVSDHGMESMRLAYRSVKKAYNSIKTVDQTIKTTRSTIKTTKQAVETTVKVVKKTAVTAYRVSAATVRVVTNVIVHIVAALINPATWIILAIGLIVYLLIVFLIMFLGLNTSINYEKQQGYSNPIGLSNMNTDLQDAINYFQIAVANEQNAFNQVIYNLYYDPNNLTYSDTVYMQRNMPPAQYATSLATSGRQNQLASAWQFGVSEADGVAIAYVYLQRAENQAHGSTNVVYPVTFTQAVFDTVVAEMVEVTEQLYYNQACPSQNCTVHYQYTPNPAYQTALDNYNYAVLKYNDWITNVTPQSNAYLNLLSQYRALPPAGQGAMQAALDYAFQVFRSAVDNWSYVFNTWGLTVDEFLDTNMLNQLANEVNYTDLAVRNTPPQISTPYYTCDYQHTLHSIGLYFYTADDTMTLLGFTAEERSWVQMTTLSIQQYLLSLGVP